MNRVSFKKYALPFTVIFIIGILVDVFLLPLVTYSGTAQKYRDIIFGLSEYNTNKSGELTLFKLTLLFMCIAIIFASRLIHSPGSIADAEANSKPYPIILLLFLNIGYYLFIGTLNEKIIAASIFYCFAYILYGSRANMLALLGVCSYYSITALISLSTICTQHKEYILWQNISQMEIFILAFVLVAIVIFIWKQTSEKYLTLVILCEQFIIPFNLLMYLKNRYSYNGSVHNISFPVSYKLIILAVFSGSILTAAVHFYKLRTNTQPKWGDLISLSTIMTIFIMNSYIVPARIIPSDFWHHGEQVTSFHQTVTLGQEIYKEFAPSSGAFSFPVGFLIHIMDGKPVSYPAAYSLIAFIAAIITAVLCYRLAGGKMALLIALSTGSLVYDRGLLVLPYLLILTMPNLIKNRSAWIKIWILATLFSGIYYPTIGIALLMATMPFGLIQIYQFFKNKEWNEKKKHWVFWITWLGTIGCVAFSAKLLLNMASYILCLAGQSLEADSFTLLSCTTCPDYFLPWMGQGFRYAFYLFARLSLAAIVVVLPVTLFFIIGRMQNKKEFFSSPMSLALSASPIFMLVYYSYSLLRADDDILMSRTAVGVLAVSQYLLIVLYLNRGKYITNKLNNALSGILFAILVSSFSFSPMAGSPNVDLGIQTGGIVNDSERLSPVYEIDETDYSYTYFEGTDAWLGEGFIKTVQLESARPKMDFIEQHNMEDEYYINFDRFQYLILNVKAAYVDATSILKSVKSQQRLIEELEGKDPIITSFSITSDYEMVKWMMDHDYKKLGNEWYASPSTIEKYGLAEIGISEIETRQDNYGRSANAFGKSFHTLEKQFTRNKILLDSSEVIATSGLEKQEDSYVVTDPENITLQINFPEAINGKEYDYLYFNFSTDLDFSKEYSGTLDDRLMTYFSWNSKLDANNVTIYWSDENGVYSDEKACTMSLQTGELLIPIGYNSSWRNNNNSCLQIRMSGNFEQGTRIELKDFRILGR